MKYKALVCDVDGTLIYNNSGSLPTEKVTKFIKLAQEKLHVTIATARPLELTVPIIEHLRLTSPCIITGGAQIYDPVKKEIISEKLLSQDQVRQIWEVGQKYKIPLLAADSSSDLELTNPTLVNKPLDIYTYPMNIDDAIRFMGKIQHISHIAVHKTPAWNEKGFNNVHVVISHPEATKHYGILKIAEILEISTHNIIGVGEGYNDFPLLMACGLKIAMGNAVDDLKEIADYIAPTVEDDGVAEVIDKFILS